MKAIGKTTEAAKNAYEDLLTINIIIGIDAPTYDGYYHHYKDEPCEIEKVCQFYYTRHV